MRDLKTVQSIKKKTCDPPHSGKPSTLLLPFSYLSRCACAHSDVLFSHFTLLSLCVCSFLSLGSSSSYLPWCFFLACLLFLTPWGCSDRNTVFYYCVTLSSPSLHEDLFCVQKPLAYRSHNPAHTFQVLSCATISLLEYKHREDGGQVCFVDHCICTTCHITLHIVGTLKIIFLQRSMFFPQFNHSESRIHLLQSVAC